MQRRVWIRQVLVAGIGMMCLPAVAGEAGAEAVTLRNIRITGTEENLLALLAETIIPATDTPGAQALNIHHFVLKMMDDCYDQAAQQKMKSGLGQLERFADQKSGAPFSRLLPEQRLVLLRSIRDGADTPNELRYLLNEVRRQTIRGYENSEYFLTKIRPYELVPGRFDGCKKTAV